MRGAAAGVVLAAALASGCRCADERPFTPYRLEDAALPRAADAASSAGARDASPPFAPRAAVAAPPDAATWEVEGVAVSVEADRVLDQALVADLDADGAPEAVAWTRSRAAATPAHAGGELVVFSSRAPAGRVVARFPAFLPAAPACRHRVALSRTGPATVTLDVATTCEGSWLPRSPTRAVMVVAPLADRAELMTLRLADAAPGERLDVAVDSRDRDGDGRDDVRATFRVAADVDGAEAALDLLFLDRAQGAARDPSEPARGLAAIASHEAVRAPGKNTGREVPGRVAAARRAFASLCAESGTARVTDGTGAALPCPGGAEAVAELLVPEVLAALSRGDLLAAAGALSRDGWYGARLPPRARARVERQIRAAAPPREVDAFPVAARPRERSATPGYSPLAYDADGALRVATAGGVERARDGGDGAHPGPSWPLVAIGGGRTWTGVAASCERSELVLLATTAEGTPLPPEPLPVLAPRPGPCVVGGELPALRAVPLAWSEARRAGLVAGSLFGARSLAELGAPEPGSPRSPDGATLVAPSPLGLLVIGPKRTELWNVPGSLELTGCVVANAGAEAACLDAPHTARRFVPRP